jgi:hypothetical protein
MTIPERLALLRKKGIQPSALRVREVVQFSIADDCVPVRYDFAYRDPASGRRVQWCVEVLENKDIPSERDQRIIPPVKACIAKHLRSKCGIDLAVANQLELELPRTTPGRFV